MVDEVPLVDQDPARPPGLLDLARHPHVPRDQPVNRINQQQRDVRAPDRLRSPQRRVVRHPASPPDALRHPRRIQQQVPLGLSFYLDLNLTRNRVGGGTGHLGDDGPLGAEQPVQEGALAHVGPADDGELRQLWLLVGRGFGQEGDDGVEEVADAEAVDGRDRVGLAFAQSVEAVAFGVVGGVVQLVDGEDHLRLRAAQLAGDGRVGLRGAQAGVGEVEYHVGLLDGDPRLEGDEGLEADLCFGFHPARVHEVELGAGPLGPVVRAVAGRAGPVGDDGGPAAQDAVDHRTLPDVRGAHDRHDGQPAHGRSPFGSA